MSSSDLIARANAWLVQDPDPETAAELRAIIERADAGDAPAIADLSDRFDSRLTFGTAGLRGKLGAGPNRMNRVLVTQAAHGFATFLLQREANPSVVIGYDGRVNSDVFARDSAEIFAGLGLRVILFDRAVPTPVVATALREMGLSAGVVVTASHNPPRDNGYKVYLGGDDQGSQIVSPDDTDIEALILRAANLNIADFTRSSVYETAPESLIDTFVQKTAAISTRPATPVRFVYTAMHGVGWEVANRCYLAAGLGDAIVVTEQIHPDGSFPTVAFPNPEEPGALDLAYATADRAGVELIIANDPDADRLAVAIRENGEWRRLTGNEVGSLLGWRAAERHKGSGSPGALAASIVSSPALGAVAADYGIDFSYTLTGFKFVNRVPKLIFGFEEALGYLVDPDKVRDKDGISAAVDFLAMAGELQERGLTIADHLIEFADRFGAFASTQISIRVANLSDIPAISSRFRDAPPATLGGHAVTAVDDFMNGFENFPPTDLIRLTIDGGSRVIVRPSGTEPKLKIYIDAAVTEGVDRSARVADVVAAIESDLRAFIA
ncbi:MAG: phospho-sugar mutase [Microbacteriaceae bacterium]|nr:phospho-sugar mutase [Microbacteriaceae bacterium]